MVMALFTLSDIEGQPRLEMAQTFHSPETVTGEKDSTRKQVLTAVSVASAAASLGSAILAYRFMSRADAAYQHYRHAGNPTDMNRYFKRAETHDRNAGYSLVMFEVFFAVTVYSALLSFTP